MRKARCKFEAERYEAAKEKRRRQKERAASPSSSTQTFVCPKCSRMCASRIGHYSQQRVSLCFEPSQSRRITSGLMSTTSMQELTINLPSNPRSRGMTHHHHHQIWAFLHSHGVILLRTNTILHHVFTNLLGQNETQSPSHNEKLTHGFVHGIVSSKHEQVQTVSGKHISVCWLQLTFHSWQKYGWNTFRIGTQVLRYYCCLIWSEMAKGD